MCSKGVFLTFEHTDIDYGALKDIKPCLKVLKMPFEHGLVSTAGQTYVIEKSSK